MKPYNGGWFNAGSKPRGAASPGLSLDTWLRRRGCDQRTINQITARRFRYGSYRPSDRQAIQLDCTPELTPYAAD